MNDDFFAEFDKMFAELARRSRPGRFEPNADVFSSADGSEILVNVEIAGADVTDLRVMVEDRRLFIAGRRHDPERAERGSLHMKEIEFGDFVKKIHLPVDISSDAATASYRDGILSIRLPVSPSRRPAHRTELRMTVRRIPA